MAEKSSGTNQPPSNQLNKTRRRFLQVASVGSVGIAGCTSFGLGEDETPASQLSTLFPTWRGHDPTSAVTLQWLAPTEDSEPISVSVVAENGEASSVDETEIVPFGDSELSRHRAVLTELESDTSYRIAVADEETELSIQTAPTELTEPLTFAEGGDIGTSSSVPPLHEQAASWDPLFGLVGGDLAYADGYDVGEWIAFLEDWNEYMRSGDRLIPLVAAIGGHELQGDDEFFGTPEEAPLYYALFDNVRRDHAYWALDIGDYLSILLLDSNHTTKVEGTQTEWLEGALAERTDRSHVMTTGHIPAYPSAKPIEDEERGDIREHWVPLFEAYDVDIVFEHDDHSYKRTKRLRDGESAPDEGILYVGDGAWGKGPREVYSSDERPYLERSESEWYVLRTDISPDGSRQFQAITVEGDVIDRFGESDSLL